MQHRPLGCRRGCDWRAEGDHGGRANEPHTLSRSAKKTPYSPLRKCRIKAAIAQVTAVVSIRKARLTSANRRTVPLEIPFSWLAILFPVWGHD
jgi:hypothetical protein